MSGLTSKVATLMTGSSPVPSSPGAMGSLPSSGGLFGEGGKINFDMLSAGFSLGSAALTMFGANEQAAATLAQSRQESRALELTAREDLLQAKQEEIKGKQDANQIMDNLIQTIASSRLAAAVNGVDPGFGTPVSVEGSQKKIANLQMGVTREDAVIRSLSRRRQSFARRVEAGNVLIAGKKEARGSRMSGLAAAGGTLAELVQRRSERG